MCAVSRCRADCGLKMDATLFNPQKSKKNIFFKRMKQSVDYVTALRNSIFQSHP